MKYSIVLVFLGLLYAASVRAQEEGAPSDPLFKRDGNCGSNTFISDADLLAMHNLYRSAAGESSLSWDNGLAEFAQCWASRCKFEHSHRSGYGENIACGNGNQLSPAIGVKNWWDEYKMWEYGEGYSEATGHFTQMAWDATRYVGCGVAKCPSGNLGLGGGSRLSTFIVCSYYPPGNVIGQFSGHVKKPSYEPNVQSFISKSATSSASNKYVAPVSDYDSTSTNDYSSSQSGNKKSNNQRQKNISKFGQSKMGTGHAHNSDGTSYYKYSPADTSYSSTSSSSNGLLGSVIRRRHHHDIAKRKEEDDCDEE